MKQLYSTVLLVSALFVMRGYGQQVPQYTQYFLNDFTINPGVTGTKNAWYAQTNARYQWVGIRDAPRTVILNANGPIEGLNMGVGGYLFSDVVGPTRRTGISGSYAYHLKLSKDIKLGMGLSLGATNWRIDGAAISLQDEADLALGSNMRGIWVPDAGVGLHLYSDDFWIGVSAPQVLGNELRFSSELTENMARLERHYFFTAGYNFEVSDDFTIQPAFFIKYIEPLPIMYDVTLRGLYKDIFWAGVAYRVDESVGAMVGIQIQDNLLFGYSYDVPTGALSPFTTGSHELMIGFKFKKRTSNQFRKLKF